MGSTIFTANRPDGMAGIPAFRGTAEKEIHELGPPDLGLVERILPSINYELQSLQTGHAIWDHSSLTISWSLASSKQRKQHRNYQAAGG